MPAQRTVPTSSQSRNSESGAPAAAASAPPLRPLIKVALLGDSQVGKTSLMNRFIEGTFDDTELQTQGVNFMEKTVSIRGHEVTFSIWDIGGHKDFESMLPLACNDAAAMLLLFDLSKPETLDRIRVWHQKARERNKFATPVLVGCKFDLMLEASALSAPPRSALSERHELPPPASPAGAAGGAAAHCADEPPVCEGAPHLCTTPHLSLTPPGDVRAAARSASSDTRRDPPPLPRPSTRHSYFARRRCRST